MLIAANKPEKVDENLNSLAVAAQPPNSIVKFYNKAMEKIIAGANRALEGQFVMKACQINRVCN